MADNVRLSSVRCLRPTGAQIQSRVPFCNETWRYTHKHMVIIRDRNSNFQQLKLLKELIKSKRVSSRAIPFPGATIQPEGCITASIRKVWVGWYPQGDLPYKKCYTVCKVMEALCWGQRSQFSRLWAPWYCCPNLMWSSAPRESKVTGDAHWPIFPTLNTAFCSTPLFAVHLKSWRQSSAPILWSLSLPLHYYLWRVLQFFHRDVLIPVLYSWYLIVCWS